VKIICIEKLRLIENLIICNKSKKRIKKIDDLNGECLERKRNHAWIYIAALKELTNVLKFLYKLRFFGNENYIFSVGGAF
jgi:hypothetical protein